MADAVNHPSHYNEFEIECIDVVKHFAFCRGNAIKYLWRAGSKGDIVEDLRKAIFYIDQEIMDIEQKREEERAKHPLMPVNMVDEDDLLARVNRTLNN